MRKLLENNMVPGQTACIRRLIWNHVVLKCYKGRFSRSWLICILFTILPHVLFGKDLSTFLYEYRTVLISTEAVLYNNTRSLFNRLTTTDVIPTIYIVTPTYKRLEQKAELTRLSQTLRLVQNIHWVVVEDSKNKTNSVTKFLVDCRILNTHLFVKSLNQTEWRNVFHKGRNETNIRRGVLQRNLALDWLAVHAKSPHVIYFADDDNTYDVRLFEQMRYTRKVSVWPVGLAGSAKYESPAVKNGKVVGWIVGVLPKRRFGIDMAGFAVNGDLIKRSRARFSSTSATTLESHFLQSLNVTLDELEPKANNCTQILVWHTRTQKSSTHADKQRQKKMREFMGTELEV